MNKIYKTSRKCLAAQNKDGKFFALYETYQTTTPYVVDSPQDAKLINPRGGFDSIKEAPYYFENSDRMRRWLEGFEMVIVDIETTATIQEK